MPRPAGPLFLLPTLLAAPLAAQQTPTYNNVRSEMRTSPSGDGYQISVENGSDLPITVNGVVLMDCENIRGNCAGNPLKVRIGPHRDQVVLYVHTRDATRGSTFRYRFTFEQDTERMEADAKKAAEKAAKEGGKLQLLPTTPAPAPVSDQAQPDAAAQRAQALQDSIQQDKLERLVAAAAARNAAVVKEENYDSLVVSPSVVDLPVGATISLSTGLHYSARSSTSGRELPLRHFEYTVEAGANLITISSGTIRGNKPGTAVLRFTMGLPADSTGKVKGVSRLVLHVTP